MRLAEEKTSSANKAVKRLSANIVTLEQRLATAESTKSEVEQRAANGGDNTGEMGISPTGGGRSVHEAETVEAGSGSDSSTPGDATDTCMPSSPSAQKDYRKGEGDRRARPSRNRNSGDDRDARPCQGAVNKMSQAKSSSSPSERPPLSSSLPSSPSPGHRFDEGSTNGSSAFPSATVRGGTIEDGCVEGGDSADSGDEAEKPTCDRPLQLGAHEDGGSPLLSSGEKSVDDHRQQLPSSSKLVPLRRSSLGSSGIVHGALGSETSTHRAATTSQNRSAVALGTIAGVVKVAPTAALLDEEQKAGPASIALVAVPRSGKSRPAEVGADEIANIISSGGGKQHRARGEGASTLTTALGEEMSAEGLSKKQTGETKDGSEEDASKGESDERSIECSAPIIDTGEARTGTAAAETPSHERNVSTLNRIASDEGAEDAAVSKASKASRSFLVKNLTEDGNSGRMNSERNTSSVGRAKAGATDPVLAARMDTGFLEKTAAPAEYSSSATLPRKEDPVATQDGDKEEKEGGSEEGASSDVKAHTAKENDARMTTQLFPSVNAESPSRGALAPPEGLSDTPASKAGTSHFVEKMKRGMSNTDGQYDGGNRRDWDGAAEQEVSASTNSCANFGDDPSPIPETRDRSAFSRASLEAAGRPAETAVSAVRPTELGPLERRSIPPVGSAKLEPLEFRSTSKVSTDHAAEAPDSERISERSRDGKLHDGREAHQSESDPSKEGRGDGVVGGRMPSEGGSTKREEISTVVPRRKNETDEVDNDTLGGRDCGGNSDDGGNRSSDDSSKASEGSSWTSKTGASSRSPSSGESAVSTPRNAVGRKETLRARDSEGSSGSRKRSGLESKKTPVERKLVEGVDEALSNRAFEQARRAPDGDKFGKREEQAAM